MLSRWGTMKIIMHAKILYNNMGYECKYYQEMTKGMQRQCRCWCEGFVTLRFISSAFYTITVNQHAIPMERTQNMWEPTFPAMR